MRPLCQESHKITSKRVYYASLTLLMLGLIAVVLTDIRKKASGKNRHR